MDDPVRREFRERFVTNKTSIWITLEDGIEKVRQGLFAFHVDTAAGYQLIQETYEEDEKCGLQEIDYMGVLDPMLVIKKKSPYREIFRVGSVFFFHVTRNLNFTQDGRISILHIILEYSIGNRAKCSI